MKTAAGKTADVSQDVFTSVEAGQRTAIAAVRSFVDTVDSALPPVPIRLAARPSSMQPWTWPTSS